MTASLATKIRTLVAEDLAAEEVSALRSEDRREFARQRIFVHMDALGIERLASDAPLPTSEEEQRLAQSILDALFGMGGLQSLIDDPAIENIDVNGCDRVWVTYADGAKRTMPPIADSDEELIEIIRSAAAKFGLSERRFDMARPELDLRLPDGSRLSALMAVTTRPAVSVRRHRFVDLSIDDLIGLGTIDAGIASFLAAAVRARKNIVVAGAMNSGKTTLLRALASVIPPRERLVTIEQSLELALDNDSARHPDIVALEARPANLEGEGMVGVADLVRRALRMNADRVIVGEVLGDEILPMLNAMSQGRSGSMCTIHADSSAGVFRRIASYAVQAPERLPLEATNLLVAGAVHFVVFLDIEHPTVTDGAPYEDDFARVPPSWPASDAALGVGHQIAQGGSPRRADGTDNPDEGDHSIWFAGPARRQRFVSSIREVVDAEGSQVISNEIFRPGPDRRAAMGAPLRPDTLRDLVRHGYEPINDHDDHERVWA
ncbi:MAG TPA: ATPase, T2SS/T4P/T4SS family [Acidimicrobiales bacterium]|jgi:pilus assembly protein CpaF|nr:ATPase, T2SS/T4P/T4SS family [Acidimicrobiales bacterium]